MSIMKKRIKEDHAFGKIERSEISSSQHDSRSLILSPKSLLILLLTFRIINACIVRTWYVPDEYWQAPEVAHNVVFGYGYLTWEWKQGLRGYTFPLTFAVAYKLLALLGMDSAEVLILVPTFMQSILAAFGDFYLYRLSNKLFGSQSAWWTLLCNLISWFTFYCITRTLSNSCETVLTTIALYYWPLNSDPVNRKNSNLLLALVIAALACLVRPTSAIIWIPLSVMYLIRTDSKLTFIFMYIIPVGMAVLTWSVCIDSLFYGRLTFVQYNFVLFNVVKDMGTFYGSHPWHWYFTQGFPAVLFTHLPVVIAGVFKSSQRLPAVLVIWVVFIYSCLGHKEFRFIFPVVPLCMCYCGVFLHYLTKPLSSQPVKDQTRRGWSKTAMVFTLLCITNIPLALYTSTVHQKGVIDAMKYLRHQVQGSTQPISVLFLMPCHSTPFYSHIHQNISMRFLECPPSDSPEYVDEAARFYQDPMSWIDKEFPIATQKNGPVVSPLPTHIVFFSSLTEKIQPFLANFKYQECYQFFHTHMPEGRIGARVLVYC